MIARHFVVVLIAPIEFDVCRRLSNWRCRLSKKRHANAVAGGGFHKQFANPAKGCCCLLLGRASRFVPAGFRYRLPASEAAIGGARLVGRHGA